MIVDAHAHAFPKLGEAAGWNSPEEYIRYVQWHMTTHQQGATRFRDNVRVTQPTLWDGKNPGLDGLLEVNFHVGAHGRFEWETAGERYYLQFLPPTLEDMTARPERMLAQMQYLGVEKALLQSGRLYGLTNTYLAEIVHQWPEKFRGCAIVDENQADSADQIRGLRRAVTELGLSALYFSNDGYARAGYQNHFDDDKFIPFWEEVQALGIPVIWDIRFARRRTHADYLSEALRLQRHLRRFPEIQNVLSHGMPANSIATDGNLLDDLWPILKEPNLTVELLFPLLHGGSWEYPFVPAHSILRQLYEKLGPAKLVWGSDMPNVERSCTYRQSLDYVRNHCTFIRNSDLDLILAKNALQLYFS